MISWLNLGFNFFTKFFGDAFAPLGNANAPPMGAHLRTQHGVPTTKLPPQLKFPPGSPQRPATMLTTLKLLIEDYPPMFILISLAKRGSISEKVIT